MAKFKTGDLLISVNSPSKTEIKITAVGEQNYLASVVKNYEGYDCTDLNTENSYSFSYLENNFVLKPIPRSVIRYLYVWENNKTKVLGMNGWAPTREQAEVSGRMWCKTNPDYTYIDVCEAKYEEKV